MNTDLAGAVTLATELSVALREHPPADEVMVGVAPPFCFLAPVKEVLQGSSIELIAQDCHPEAKGAFTGAVSAPMLASLGVQRVIVGHSERRAVFGDDDATVRRKLEAALGAGMRVILCCGETLAQREAGQAEEVVGAQLKAGLEGLSADQLAQVIVAYEPVWAIGTGVTATPEQAGAMHTALREQVLPDLCNGDAPAVLYGGSVKPANIDALAKTAHVGGVLVGGASLEASSFARIVQGCAG
ncbi:MAG TPA: triose-phosphate isomerase [Planctomycetes bacterium]|nr:triose-phosphate isomerase [Planctomycetota bacterium]